MKKSILVLLAIILFSYPINLMGADFETPHEFKAGDTISAEMMNELFENINLSFSLFTPKDLVGKWECVAFKWSNSTLTGWKNMPSGCSEQHGNNGCFYSILENPGYVTFIDDGDGTFSLTTPEYSPLVVWNGSFSGNYDVIVGNIFIWQDIPHLQGEAGYFMKKRSKNSLFFNRIHYSGNSNFPDFISCDKINLAPNPPSSFTYALPADNSSSSITLTWTDNQTGAITGYKVNRKTVVTDNFTTVSTITDNTTRTYADDNVTESGKYWYRVLAYNSNGEGTPSKVVKAEFPDDQAPTGTLKIDNATASTTSSSVTLNMTASDNKGVVGYLASESSAPPSADSSSWVSITSTKSYSADVSFTLSSGYGVKFVYVWYKDGKGNIAGYGASITYSSE